MNDFLDKITNDILKKNNYIDNIVEKAFGLPKMPSVDDMVKKQVGDTITRGKKQYRIAEIDPSKTGWGRFKKLEPLTPSEDDKISTKEKKELPQKGESVKLTKEEKQGFKEKIDKLKDKVSQELKEKLGKIEEKPKQEKTEEKLSRELATPKKEGESQEEYNLRLWVAGTNFLNEYAKKLENIPADGEAAKIKKNEINRMIKDIYGKINNNIRLSTPSSSTGVTYEDAKNRIKEFENKIVQGQKLTRDEGKEYDKLNRQINKEDERTNEILAKTNEKNIMEKRDKKLKEIKQSLEKGEKLYNKRGEYDLKPLKITEEERKKDIGTFLAIRYDNLPLDKVKKNNKEVINSFVKLNDLKNIIDGKIKTNSARGEVKFPFNIDTIKTLEKRLKLAYGKNAPEFFSIDRGSPGGETIITVKKVAGNDWEIKPLPTKNIGQAINDLQKEYKNESDKGKRIQYKFEFAPGKFLTTNPGKEGGDDVMILQGGTRSGKGATFGTMMNQALGSANGNIVQFHNFDPTGAFWKDMEGENPKIREQMKEKGLLKTDAVQSESLQEMDAKTQAKSLKNIVNNFVETYNSEYAKRDALMSATPGASHMGKVKDQQIPQAVFNFDEMQVFEGMILNNTELEDADKSQLLQKMAGVLNTQKTNGKKRAITVNIGVQQGFASKELRGFAKSPGNTLVSLDGEADLSTFGRIRGFQDAVKTASIGNAVVLKTQQPDQKPKTQAPIIPGAGTAEKLAKKYD